MTTSSPSSAESPPLSLSLFDESCLTMRLQQAQFARLVGVSRQAVSRWVKEGVVQVGADDRIDPIKAIRQLMERNPALLRARVFRVAFADQEEQRRRIADLEAQLADARKVANGTGDAEARRLFNFTEALEQRFTEAAQAFADGRLQTWLDELFAVVCWGWDLEEYRADKAEAEDEGDDA